MSDLIDRQEAIDVVRKWFALIGLNGDICIDGITSLPAVDIDLSGYSDRLWKGAHERGKQDAMAKIVHCKDCKYATMTIDGECKYCDIWFPDEPVYTEGDYYCASGERRADE